MFGIVGVWRCSSGSSASRCRNPRAGWLRTAAMRRPRRSSRPSKPRPHTRARCLQSRACARRAARRLGLEIVPARAVSRPIRFWAVFLHIVVDFSLYGFIGWLPTFLIKDGHSMVSSLGYTTLMSLGGPVGSLIGLALADIVGRKASIVGSSLTAAAFGLTYPFMSDGAPLALVGFCLVSAIYVMLATGFAMHVPGLFRFATVFVERRSVRRPGASRRRSCNSRSLRFSLGRDFSECSGRSQAFSCFRRSCSSCSASKPRDAPWKMWRAQMIDKGRCQTLRTRSPGWVLRSMSRRPAGHGHEASSLRCSDRSVDASTSSRRRVPT